MTVLHATPGRWYNNALDPCAFYVKFHVATTHHRNGRDVSLVSFTASNARWDLAASSAGATHQIRLRSNDGHLNLRERAPCDGAAILRML